jgi:predicted metal-dependent hydrolase
VTGREPGRPVATETSERVELPGGSLAYTLRRSRRARRLRVVIDARRGVVVTIPGGRPGAGAAAAHVEPFLRDREDWIRGHLATQAHQRSTVAGAAPTELVDGARLRFRGSLHILRLETAPAGARRSSVLVGWSAADPGGRELVVRLARADRRPLARVLEAWLRDRAAIDIEAAVAHHAPALGVTPSHVALRDPRTRWGSAGRTGRIALSWRLVLAPPEALETVVVHELAHLRVFGHGPDFWALVESRVPEHRAWRRWLRTHSVELHASLAPSGSLPT